MSATEDLYYLYTIIKKKKRLSLHKTEEKVTDGSSSLILHQNRVLFKRQVAPRA